MKKFDSFLQKYITEAELSLTPNVVSSAQKGIETAPAGIKKALDTVSKILDPNNAGKNGELHKKLSDIIDPETKTSFNDLNEIEAKQAIEILTKAGFPINMKTDNTSKEVEKTSPEKTTQNQTTISNSTNYSA